MVNECYLNVCFYLNKKEQTDLFYIEREMGKIARYLNVMLVTENRVSPRNFKISFFIVKIILGLFVVAVLLTVFGVINYWRMTVRTSDYDIMCSKLEKAQENEVLMNRIFQDFKELQEMNYRIRRSLGVRLQAPTVVETTGDELSEASFSNDLNSNAEPISISASIRNTRAYENKSLNLHAQVPSLLPVEGFISRPFEKYDPITGNVHNGIDIVASEGSVIRAVAEGSVIFSAWTPESGYKIIIDHMNGYLSFYEHNKRLMVSDNEYVRKGDIIALMGNSGRHSTGTHLHFELWKNGQPIDPKLYLGYF